jgi:flagellar hook-associated protein 2
MATSVGSTVLDVPSLVSQLMSVERQPIDKLNAKVTDYQSRISTFGSIKSLVSSFHSALTALQNSLQGHSATTSDAVALAASASSAAVAGSYVINVTRLAQAQNLVAAGQASDTSAISTIASTVTFTIAGVSTDVSIAAGATLQDIRTAINSANLGVNATIINDGSGTPYRLALSASDTGLSKAISSITIQAGGDDAINNLLAWNPTGNVPIAPTLAQTMAAQDASLTVNGIAVASASNTVGGAIQGVTLTLKSVTTSAATVAVARDTESINAAANKFVETYSALVKELKSRSAYGATGSSKPVLAGDSAVRQMLDQLRNIFLTPASGGTLSNLAEVGISTQADSALKFDNTKLASAMATNFGDVTNLLNSSTGFLTRLNTWATSVQATGGLIDSRTTALNSSIKGFNEQVSRLEKRMTALQKQYTTTYTNLNLFLANMNSTSSYLSSQFSGNKS